MRFTRQRRRSHRYFMDQQIDIGSEFHDVLIVPRVVGDHYRATIVVNSIPQSGLYGRTVVHAKGSHLQTARFMDHPILGEFLGGISGMLSRQFLIGDSNFYISGVGCFPDAALARSCQLARSHDRRSGWYAPRLRLAWQDQADRGEE